jgi:hypothetical protein
MIIYYSRINNGLLVKPCHRVALAVGCPLTRHMNSTQHRLVGPASPRVANKWARRTGVARATQDQPSFDFSGLHMGQPLCCLHSALVAFFSRLIARAHETPLPQVGAAIAFASLWPPSSRPSFMRMGLVLPCPPRPHLPCSLRLGFLLFVFFLSFFCCRLVDSLLQNPLLMSDLFDLCYRIHSFFFLVLLMLPSFSLFFPFTISCCRFHSCRQFHVPRS